MCGGEMGGNVCTVCQAKTLSESATWREEEPSTAELLWRKPRGMYSAWPEGPLAYSCSWDSLQGWQQL